MLLPVSLASSFALAAALITSAAAQEQEQKTIGQIYASDASVTGAVQMAGSGMQVMSGSSVGAGQGMALLRLSRGGNVRICPRTNLALSSSRDGLMIGMNSGSVETDYSLAAGTPDAIITPDFRIMFTGPGDIRVAIGADARGNTCIRPLVNNTASFIVSELMSDATYQVKPNEQVMFERGKVANMFHVIAECGCPAPPPVKLASAPLEIPRIADLRSSPPPPSLSIPLEQPVEPTRPLPASTPQDIHVEVDAPFVFSALEPEPAPMAQLAELKFSSAPPFALSPRPPQSEAAGKASKKATMASGVAPEGPKRKSGFFGKVRSFFASVFH